MSTIKSNQDHLEPFELFISRYSPRLVYIVTLQPKMKRQVTQQWPQWRPFGLDSPHTRLISYCFNLAYSLGLYLIHHQPDQANVKLAFYVKRVGTGCLNWDEEGHLMLWFCVLRLNLRKIEFSVWIYMNGSARLYWGYWEEKKRGGGDTWWGSFRRGCMQKQQQK